MKHENQTYQTVTDENGDRYYCPLDFDRVARDLNIDELEECVGHDVVGRYAGNIDIL